MLDVFLCILAAAVAVAVGLRISRGIQWRRSIARIRDTIARAPGMEEEQRARLMAEVPQRLKEAMMRSIVPA